MQSCLTQECDSTVHNVSCFEVMEPVRVHCAGVGQDFAICYASSSSVLNDKSLLLIMVGLGVRAISPRIQRCQTCGLQSLRLTHP